MIRWKKIIKKEEGSSIYIWITNIFLLLITLISLSMFQRSADTLSDNLKTSLDTANLAATTVNVEEWLKKDKFGIVGCASDTPGCTAKEREMVIKRYNTFQTALMENVGLTNNFEFSGGTCGWAGNYISSGTLKIDKFIIYEIVNDNVYSYTVENITSYTSQPNVIKKYCGKVGTAKTEEFTHKQNKVITKTIDGPIILSKVEFPIDFGFLMNHVFCAFYDGSKGNPIDETLTVSMDGITEIKTNDENFE